MSAPRAGKLTPGPLAVFIAVLGFVFAPLYSETLSRDWINGLSSTQYFKHVSFLASDDLKDAATEHRNCNGPLNILPINFELWV